jgi:hypothetical protein
MNTPRARWVSPAVGEGRVRRMGGGRPRDVAPAASRADRDRWLPSSNPMTAPAKGPTTVTKGPAPVTRADPFSASVLQSPPLQRAEPLPPEVISSEPSLVSPARSDQRDNAATVEVPVATPTKKTPVPPSSHLEMSPKKAGERKKKVTPRKSQGSKSVSAEPVGSNGVSTAKQGRKPVTPSAAQPRSSARPETSKADDHEKWKKVAKTRGRQRRHG